MTENERKYTEHFSLTSHIGQYIKSKVTLSSKIEKVNKVDTYGRQKQLEL